MSQANRFRKLLPVAQTVSAALLGGWGLWRRNEILSQSSFVWTSTAQFHVWPWPYRFAVVSNTPAFLAGMLISWPIGSLWPELPASVFHALSLLFVPILWYWVGYRFDLKWGVTEGGRASQRSRPWVFMLIFTLVCVMGSFLPIRYGGYIGYLPYGAAVWIATILIVRHLSKVRVENSSGG